MYKLIYDHDWGMRGNRTCSVWYKHIKTNNRDTLKFIKGQGISDPRQECISWETFDMDIMYTEIRGK